MTTVLHYQDQTGKLPFISEMKSVGAGVIERRIHWGPGYRVYFGRDGDRLVILLAGGTKERQSADIATARSRWNNYLKRTRRKET